MTFSLTLPVPVETDVGLECLFHYRTKQCRFVSGSKGFRLWIETRELEASRVLDSDEQQQWSELQEDHYRWALLPPGEPPKRLLCLYVELILRRYFDVIDGKAPQGWGDQ